MAEKAALNLLRRLASDFNVRDAGKLYQISKREFLDQPAVGEPRNGRLEEGCGKADAGPEAPDLIDFSQTRGAPKSTASWYRCVHQEGGH